MNLTVSPHLCVTGFVPADIEALTEYLADEDIYNCTLRIPRPYTRADAERWFALLEEEEKQGLRPLKWAIRQREELVGGIGLEPAPGQPHRAELGYWLAKPFWNQGIMTSVVSAVCRHAFQTLGLVKITAYVFSFNASSARVLQKCGFEQEGYLRKQILKDGNLIDSIVFGRCRD